MKNLLLLFFLFSASSGWTQEKLIHFVNPMVGTQKMGHTYPGATVPFARVQ